MNVIFTPEHAIGPNMHRPDPDQSVNSVGRWVASIEVEIEVRRCFEHDLPIRARRIA